jgi:diaminopimelate epimerase
MRFVKLTGAGNDFIAVDNRDGSLDPCMTQPRIAGICRRALSIGADGLLELRRSDVADYRMVYYNSDGGRASMCGNGGRCMARFAVMRGAAGPAQTFESDAGMHRAEVRPGGAVRLWFTTPVSITGRLSLAAPGPGGITVTVDASLEDTGVPHLVIFRDGLSDGLFESSARVLRWAREAGPDGANVDFACVVAPRSMMIRTWERGVEGETLACGTGAVAAVFAGLREGRLELPCTVHPPGGSPLEVGMDDAGWWLEGEARPVYEGETLEPLP